MATVLKLVKKSRKRIHREEKEVKSLEQKNEEKENRLTKDCLPFP